MKQATNEVSENLPSFFYTLSYISYLFNINQFKMTKKIFLLSLIISSISCDFAGNQDVGEINFLEANSEMIWQSTEYQEIYIGFSNNKTEVLVYKATVYSDYNYCDSYKEGENIIPGSECDWEDGETIQTYTIITNTENLLVLDLNYYDDSCDTPFSIDTRYSYSIDGDFLYETIEQIDYEAEFNEYAKSSYSFDNLCN